MGGDRRSPPHHRLKGGGGGKTRSGNGGGSGKVISGNLTRSGCKNGNSVFKKPSGKADLENNLNSDGEFLVCREDRDVSDGKVGGNNDSQQILHKSEENCDSKSAFTSDSGISPREKADDDMELCKESLIVKEDGGIHTEVNLCQNKDCVGRLHEMETDDERGNLKVPFGGSCGVAGCVNSTGVKLTVSGSNVKGQQENSVTDFHDLGILDSRTNCIINTGDVLSSEGELNGERYEFESLPVQCMNLESQCNNKTGSSHIKGISVDKVFTQEEGREPVLLTDGRKDSDHPTLNHTMKLPTGMILNVLNPMFVKDNENTRLDGDCEMMLNDEEEFCINQNSENQVNMVADTYVSNGICTKGVREVGCEMLQNINGRSIDNGASGSDYPREVGNKESNMRKINGRTNAANAWKKPVHVQVDWQNQGKASTDGKFVNLNIENVNSNRSKLEKALVGKLIGRRLPFHILSSELQKRWQPYGEFKCLLTGEESFICIFNSTEARDAVLMGGPWLIGGYVIGLDKWSPDYTHDSICGLTAPVWIRFPKLPLLYWDNDNLARIASMVGQPLWIDALTSELGRCAYARVCVRLDFGLKLPTGVWIPGINGNFFQKVEYEGINQVCFRCGHIGHKMESCALSKKIEAVETIPLTRDKTTFGWKKGNQVVHKMQVEKGSITEAEQGPSKFNTNIPMEVGNCSKSGVQSVDKDWRNNKSVDDEDAHYGPWIYVTRKKNKFKNGEAKFPAVKQDILKENHGPPMGRDNPTYNIDKGKKIYHSDNESLTQDKVNAERDLGIFTSARIPVNRFGTDFTNLKPVEPAIVFSAARRAEKLSYEEGKVGSSSNRRFKERGSNRVPSAKEISNLGPIATGSRKRRKEAADCGDLLDFQAFVDKVADGHGRLLLEDTSKCGGDASPHVN